MEDISPAAELKDTFLRFLKVIHPDVCSLPLAAEATIKLNNWKHHFENGKIYKDEAGKYNTNGYIIKHTGDKALLHTSYENYIKLKNLKDDASVHFRKYLPANIFFNGNQLHVLFSKRAIPLNGLQLPQTHVNWILNRLLEFCAWLSQNGYVHAGLHPESVFIIPENHGIQIVSFYHLTKVNYRLSGIAANYLSWYPSVVFHDKQALTVIDVELSKKFPHTCWVMNRAWVSNCAKRTIQLLSILL